MRAVVISGSERKKGITAVVSEKVRKTLSESGVQTDVIYLCDLSIEPCNGCGDQLRDCNYRLEPCQKNDDALFVFKKMIEADIIIYACPVHAFGMSHLMQIFLERIGVGYLRFDRPLINKIGACIIVGRKYSLGNVHDQLVNNMLLNRMIIPGAGFPVLIHGNEDTKTISDAEENVALEQMILRAIDVSRSLENSRPGTSFPNERIIKENYIENISNKVT